MVKGRRAELYRHRAGRENDVAGLDDLCLAVDRRELDFLARQQLAVPYQPVDLVGLEKAGDATGKLPDDARTPLLHAADVDLHVLRSDAVLLELVLRTVIEL